MKIEYKIFRIAILMFFSIPTLFFGYGTFLLGIKKYFIYGDVKNVVFKKGDFYNTKGAEAEMAGYYKGYLKDTGSLKEYEFRINIFNSAFKSPAKRKFVGEVKKGDLVNVRTLSSSSVEVLNWKGIEVNKRNNFLTILGELITILILFSLGVTCLFYIYKTLKIKTTYD